jgi:phage head maturation protease
MPARRLCVEGILYPAPASKPLPTTVKNACEEFSPAELDQLVQDVVGIPVCIEHDTARIVGIVQKARKTASNAIWVDFTVEGNTKDALYAIESVNNGTMCGLSLSHSYVFGASENRRVSMDSQLCHGDIAHKTTNELSLCADPARPGCHIHTVRSGVVAASKKVEGLISGKVCASAMESEAAAEAPAEVEQNDGQHEMSESIDAMFRATEMLKASAQATQDAQAERTAVLLERDGLIEEHKRLTLEVTKQRELVEQQSRSHAVQLQQAETARHMQTLRCLQETLIACGTDTISLPVLPEGDSNEQQRIITNTAVTLAAQAEQAIKGLANNSQTTTARATEHMHREKRAREESDATQQRLSSLAKNLQHFGGGVHQYQNTVNASAEEKMPRLAQTIVESMRDYKDGNPSALWKDYRQHYTALTGTVNASAADIPELNAQQLHPGLFDQLMHMNKGRMPAAHEIQNMYDSMRKPIERMPRRY